MADTLLAFDLKKAEEAAKKFRSESDKLKRLSDKLKREVSNVPSWWIGDSRNGVLRLAEEVVEDLGKSIKIVNEMGEDLQAVIKTKKEDENRLKQELLNAVTIGAATGTTGAVSGSSGSAIGGGGGSEYGGSGTYYGTMVTHTDSDVSLGLDADLKKWGRADDERLYDSGDAIFAAEGSIEGSVSLFEAGVYGENGHASVAFGYAEAHASGGAGLYAYDKDGNKVLAPGVRGEVGASVTAMHAEAEGKVGSDMLGLYGEGSVDVGKVSAEAGACVGVFVGEDGKYHVSAAAGASAEAILAEATARGGVSVLGTDIGVKGSVNFGVGAHADVGYEDGKLKFDVGASLGVGASIGIEIDIGGTVNAVVGKAEEAWSWFKGLWG